MAVPDKLFLPLACRRHGRCTQVRGREMMRADAFNRMVLVLLPELASYQS